MVVYLGMKRKHVIIAVILSLVVFFLVFAPMIKEAYHEDIQSHPTAYVYEDYRGAVNPIMIIEDIHDKDKYMDYYARVKNGENPIIEFTFKLLPENEIVFVINYTTDSTLAEVYSYYDFGPHGSNYTKGWVLTELIHDVPPVR